MRQKFFCSHTLRLYRLLFSIVRIQLAPHPSALSATTIGRPTFLSVNPKTNNLLMEDSLMNAFFMYGQFEYSLQGKSGSGIRKYLIPIFKNVIRGLAYTAFSFGMPGIWLIDSEIVIEHQHYLFYLCCGE